MSSMLVAISIRVDSGTALFNFPDEKINPALMHLLLANAEYRIEEMILFFSGSRLSIRFNTFSLHSDRKLAVMGLIFSFPGQYYRHYLKAF